MARSATVLKPSKKSSIVLLHGLRGAPLGLDVVANDLRAAGYEVYTPAVPPFAGAGYLPEYTPKSYTDYLARYLREHNIQRPTLIGHSMGSIIVAAFAQDHPEMISDQVILLSPISHKPAKFFSLISPLTSVLPRSVVDYVTTRYLFVPHDKELFRASLETTHQCSSDHAPSHQDLATAIRFSTRYSVADFGIQQQKVLFIAGAKDRLVSDKKTRKLAQHLQAKMEFIPDSGHLHNYEKPHETAQLILDFLD